MAAKSDTGAESPHVTIDIVPGPAGAEFSPGALTVPARANGPNGASRGVVVSLVEDGGPRPGIDGGRGGGEARPETAN